MREILFRGKLKADNGEYKKGDWVYGDLVRIKDGDRIKTCIYGFGEVDPSTVGQYTGLTDKNGKKIFEGDILQNTQSGQFEKYVVVEYVEGGFAPFTIKGYECDLDADKAEIIGNIHDNPELLKEGADNG